ncbi:MAG: WhiB family transcriptional regulator [Actinomycetota bacterium]|nr:WhiB family transcriptional regulator [Actinomycetota bacterium]
MTPQDLALLTGATLADDAWQDEALCAGVDSDSFFTVEGVPAGSSVAWKASRDAAAFALALCASCPVSAICLEHALRTPEPHGIWGGTTPGERESILLELAG